MTPTCVCTARPAGQNRSLWSGAPSTGLPVTAAVSDVQPHHRPEGITQ
jgi:uncharacterized protein YndB with AHSA1/START domain